MRRLVKKRKSARTTQPLRSVSISSWPLPGTEISVECGSWAATACAFSSGVRRSSRPLRISAGTSGSGFGLGSTARPGGHSRHCSAALMRKTSPRVNGPSWSSGIAPSASAMSGGRSAIGVSSGNGRRLSAHVVAAKRPQLRSRRPTAGPTAGRIRRSSGAGSPSTPALIAAGIAARRCELRSPSTSTVARPTAPSSARWRRPAPSMTTPLIGLASSWAESRRRSPTGSDVIARHASCAQFSVRIRGVALHESVRNGSTPSGPTTESSTRLSTWSGYVRAYCSAT